MPSPESRYLILAALLAVPARALADTPLAQAARPLQLDASSLGLLGAGIAVLALSQMLRRRP